MTARRSSLTSSSQLATNSSPNFRGPRSTHNQCAVWVQQGTEYADFLVRVIVDVEDIPEAHAFFTNFKETLKELFQQMEIWITYHDIGRV